MLSPASRILYLHGFASSPTSRKALFFARNLHAEGFVIEILDLAAGNFQALTLTGQLNVIERSAKGEPVALIGSSMGGYLAAIYAATHPEVSRLVLLAPAFDFQSLWEKQLGADRLAEWRKKGTLSVFHYGMGRQADVGYSLMEDAQKYVPFPDFSQPCLIFHGSEDSVVPFSVSEAFSKTKPNVRWTGLHSDHELTGVLDEIWKISKPFLLDLTYQHVSLTSTGTI